MLLALRLVENKLQHTGTWRKQNIFLKHAREILHHKEKHEAQRLSFDELLCLE